MQERHFPCAQCGADLTYDPGTTQLKCAYCGHENEIVPEGPAVEELDYVKHLNQLERSQATEEVITVHCGSCGAETLFDPNVVSEECPFCAAPLVKTTKTEKHFVPQGVIPFTITPEQGLASYRKWITKRWFAPNALKKYAREEKRLDGVYLPYWTYDSNTTTHYSGQRGEYYYTTESYTTVVDGKTVRRTRQVRHTRWYPANGTVYNSFDDVLVPASSTLPRKQLNQLEPWTVDAIVPYDDAFLSGFRAESYTVELDQGFVHFKDRIASTIDNTIRRDIGGDTQRILSRDISYYDVTFKHILFPIWISSYRYNEKVYRFLVNGQTGKVFGERPYSWIKIALTILLVAAIVFTIIMLAGDP